MTAIQRAIELAGGRKRLAEHFGIRTAAIEKWFRFNRIPADRVLEIEKFTGVSRHDLRPDIYPKEDTEA